MALITKHLPKDSVKDWIKTGKSTRSEFYDHLEQAAKIAQRILTNEAIINALTKDKITGEKSKCLICGISHKSQCNKVKISATSTTILKEESKSCPCCEKPVYKYKV